MESPPVIQPEASSGEPQESPPPPKKKKEPPVFMPWSFAGWLGLGPVLLLLFFKWGLKSGSWEYWGWVEFAIATPVIGVVSARFYHIGWRELKKWKVCSDTWISLGLFLAYFYSLWSLTFEGGRFCFFSEIALWVTGLSFLRGWRQKRRKSGTEDF